MALADLMVVMNGGRIEQAGTPREVFNEPRHRLRRPLHRRPQRAAGRPAGPRPRRGRAARRPRQPARRRRRRGRPRRRRVAVEYQGTCVQVRLAAPAGREVAGAARRARLRRRPGGRGPAGQPELAARGGARRWLPESTDRTSRRGEHHDDSDQLPASRPQRRPQPARRAARDRCSARPPAAASSFPAPFVHADEPIMLRYAGTGVNASNEHRRQGARKIPASPSSTPR